MRSSLLVSLVAVLSTAVPSAGQPASSASSQPPPNVLLITVDTLRPDALGWVAGRNATPHIDALAATGYRFPSAMSPLPLTQPAHASLFTGLWPRRHGIRSNGRVLAPEIPTLGERLQASGYTTAAFVSGFPLAAASGLDRGFGHYDDTFPESGAPSSSRQQVAVGGVERRADDTVTAALKWLQRAPGPWFVWIHFYDPHDPYEPEPQWQGSGPRGAYDGEVRAVDAAIGRLLQALKGGARERLTVFTADHGESLGEHGESTHGLFIYQSTMTVPLIIHWPGHVTPGESGDAVRLVDVAPTLLDVLGQPALSEVSLSEVTPSEIDGVSLRPLMEGKAWITPDAYMESQRPWLSYGWAPLRAIRRGDWKLIAAPQSELYHLAEDPLETTNLLSQERRLAGDLATSLRAVESRSGVTSSLLDDPETLARLRSLGYTGGSPTTSEAPADAVDPKLRVTQWHLLGEAQKALDSGRLDEALKRFDQVLQEDADNPFALGRSGAALAEAGRLDAALPRLRRVVELRPQDHTARRALAHAATGAGQLQDALTHWLELTRQQPRQVDGWVQLASTLGMSGAPEKAVKAFEQAIVLAPDRPDIVIKLAFAQYAAKQPEAAVASFLQAATLTGPNAFPHSGALGILLLRAGRGDEARAWLERCRRDEGDYPEARFQLARWLASRNETEAADKALRQALQARPEWRARAAAEPQLAVLPSAKE